MTMVQSIKLEAVEKVAGRDFTDPEHISNDLARMRQMARQLVEIYDDPVKCDFGPGKKPICQSDPQGRHFRIYYVRAGELFSRKNIVVVGFFGYKRPGADFRPLVQADRQFETVFHKHPGLLSLSTVRLPDDNFANLVLFSDEESKDAWNNSEPHYSVVSRISPPYYRAIRLNNGLLPDGLADPDNLQLVRVKYIAYDGHEPWRAVRALDGR